MDSISTLKDHEKLIRQKFGVKRIGIFESFAKGEEKEDSDIDVLVVFDDTSSLGINIQSHLLFSIPGL